VKLEKITVHKVEFENEEVIKLSNAIENSLNDKVTLTKDDIKIFNDFKYLLSF